MNNRFLLMLFAFGFITANAQTMYFISMFDTNDKDIGNGMKAERLLINNEMQTIAGYLEEFGYDSQFSDYSGVNCGRLSLMQAINGLQIGHNDIVVFYYGGHGARAVNDSDRFPQMCLGERNQSNWVPSSLIKNMIAKKQPRLTIVLTGCCNYPDNGVTIKSIIAQSGSYTSMANVNKAAFKELFLKAKGTVQLTSSKAGELSWCNDKGSFFALALLDVFKFVGDGSVEPNWNAVCQNVKSRISSLHIPTKDGYTKQIPDYEVNTNTGDSAPRKVDTTIKRTVNDTPYTLAQDLAMIIDKARSVETRLVMVPDILAKHFAKGAKVITLGRDMNTVVDYEDAEVFLRRVAMSPFIRQINIVEQSAGKNTQIRVHEVRTR